MTAPTAVLLIEDQPGDATLSMRALRKTGLDLDVVHAQSLANAISELSRRSFAIIFTDLNLPDGEGADICREVIANACGAPVVALSGAKAGEEVLRTGIRETLVKGAVPADLLCRLILEARSRPRSSATLAARADPGDPHGEAD